MSMHSASCMQLQQLQLEFNCTVKPCALSAHDLRACDGLNDQASHTQSRSFSVSTRLTCPAVRV